LLYSVDAVPPLCPRPAPHTSSICTAMPDDLWREVAATPLAGRVPDGGVTKGVPPPSFLGCRAAAPAPPPPATAPRAARNGRNSWACAAAVAAERLSSWSKKPPISSLARCRCRASSASPSASSCSAAAAAVGGEALSWARSCAEPVGGDGVSAGGRAVEREGPVGDSSQAAGPSIR
jgi:hypothetical protein